MNMSTFGTSKTLVASLAQSTTQSIESKSNKLPNTRSQVKKEKLLESTKNMVSISHVFSVIHIHKSRIRIIYEFKSNHNVARLVVELTLMFY